MSSRFQAGGPAQYNQACKLSSNLFVDKFNFYLVGYPGTCYTYSWIDHRAAAAVHRDPGVDWSKFKQLASH